MNQPYQGEPKAQFPDSSQLIVALHSLGGDQFDPVGLHYIEVLASRVNLHPENVRRILDAKLAQALMVFKERFDKTQGDTRAAITQAASDHPHAADELQKLFRAGDFNGVTRRIAALKHNHHLSSLAELVRDVAKSAPDRVDDGFDGHIGLRPELRVTQYFRNTWSRLSIKKRVTKELDQAPKNAGPINSQMLLLRSLALMREISPDYLNRFTSYADTLLALDQFDKAKQTSAKNASDDQGTKLPKGRRSRSR
jgi:hypothetical protein